MRRARSERNLRAEVRGLWACSYAVSTVQRQVLQRRAGLDGRAPASVRRTARGLKLSVRAVRRSQRAGLRGLRRADRSDGCAMPASTRGGAQTLFAVATAPALRPVAEVTDNAGGDRRAAEPTSQGQVLGRRSSSTSGQPSTDGSTRGARARVVAAGSEGLSPLAPLVALLMMALVGLVAVLRRDHQHQPVLRNAVTAPTTPVEATPPPVPRAAPDAAPVREPRPRPAEPAETPAATHDVRRVAGLAASGLASVAIGLLVRARRRR